MGFCMKHKIGSICITVFTFIFFTTCNLEIKLPNDTKKVSAPAVESISSGIAVSIKSLPRYTTQINIFREDASEENSLITIGIIYPEYYEQHDSFLFEDNNTLIDHTYIYSLRFLDKYNHKFFSEKSKEIHSDSRYLDKKLTYDTSDANLSLNTNLGEIIINGTIIEPEIDNFKNYYTPMMLFSSPTATQAFPIRSIEDGTYINLREIFSEDFLDCKVELLGILGQKIEFNNKKNVMKRIFTAPAKIKLPSYYADGKFTIESQKNTNGVDY